MGRMAAVREWERGMGAIPLAPMHVFCATLLKELAPAYAPNCTSTLPIPDSLQ